MSSVNDVLLSSLSALRVSQQAMAVVSANIANANTPGYARTEVALAPSTLGVTASVERATNQFLTAATQIAMSRYGGAAARADLLDRAQASFGDPTSDTSLFATIDSVWSALTELTVDPASTLRKEDAVAAIGVAFADIARTGADISSLISEADQRIADGVAQAGSLIDRIAGLNKEIQLTTSVGGDASAAQNAQTALIDELSALMDINVTQTSSGGVSVRTGGGSLLVGASAAKLSYTPGAGASTIVITDSGGTSSSLHLNDGELAGLLEARNVDLPALSAALGELAAGMADQLNAVHNENAAAPPVSSMTGRQTGLLVSDALNFSGSTVIGIVDASGDLQQKLRIDFDAGEIITESPSGAFAFGDDIGSFAAALNAALNSSTPSGQANFVDGVLSISIPSGGMAIQQDPANPSERAGRGFSHFFGLNDLASAAGPLFFETGVSSSDAHGLVAGGALSFEMTDERGSVLSTRTISITGALADAGATWDDLLAALNAPGTGLGEYGQFSLAPESGKLSFAPKPGVSAEIVQDSTQRGATGLSVAQLFGLTDAIAAERALTTGVAKAISADPDRLAVARPDLTQQIGTRLVEAGDNRGAIALAAARDSARSFVLNGASRTISVASFAALVGGQAGSMASAAQREAVSAEAVALAAYDRRVQTEGVSIDDELVRMTMYQNAYAAAARVIQAATEMMDILLTLGR